MKSKSNKCEYLHRKNFSRIFFLLVLIICCIGNILLGEEVSEEEKQLRKDLWTIREIRNRLKTNYDNVYERANELLEKYYDDPAAKGRIYLEVLKVHASSGLTRPHEAIEYAKKAEQFPLYPVDKAQLYLSWGDSIQFTTPGAKGGQLRKTRRQAATQYLKSMKVLSDNNISINSKAPKPPLPPWELNVSENVVINIPEDASPELREKLLKEKAALEERRKKREEYFKAKGQWEYQKRIVDRCVYSRDLTVKLYTTMPYDTPELEQLATEILGDPEMVDDLVNRVDGRIKVIMDKWIAPALEELPFDIDSEPIMAKDSLEPGTVPAKTESMSTDSTSIKKAVPEPTKTEDKQIPTPSPAVAKQTRASSSYWRWLTIPVGLSVVVVILLLRRNWLLKL